MSGVIVLDVLGGPPPVECSVCHRPLYDHDSRRLGVGPRCWARTHPAVPRARMPRRRAVMAAPAPRRTASADGQLALDLGAADCDPQQPQPRKVAD